jgi:hypothetical protein
MWLIEVIRNLLKKLVSFFNEKPAERIELELCVKD